MFEETLSIRYVRVLIDTVEQRGVSRTCFLKAASWDAERLAAVEGRVAASEFHRLCELALDLTGDPALGLHTMRRPRPDSVDLVGQLVAHACTVRKAIEVLLRLHKLMADECRYQLIESDDCVMLRYRCPEAASDRTRRFIAEMVMAGAYRMFRYFARHARPSHVSFEYAAPEYREEYARIFKGVERFAQPSTGIVFDRALLDAERRYRDEEYHVTLQQLADSRIARLERNASSAASVREALARLGAGGKPSMAAVARELGVSTRTLRRRLTAEGTSFDAVVHEALATRARHLLVIEQRTIQETAYELGYSDTTAFHRAFKRWTGTTPSTWLAGRKPPAAT